MKKLNIILPCAVIVALLCLAVSVLQAWYVNADSMNQMGFNILQIDSLVSMYQGDDFNYNGVPDLAATQNTYYNEYIEDENKYVEYINMYHTEKYAFKYLDQKYALSAESSSNILQQITITEAVPSKVYTYKYEITNYVQKENDFDFTFVSAGYTGSLSYLKDFKVRLGVVNADATVSFTSWTALTDGTSISDVSLNPVVGGMKIPAKSKKAGTTTDLSVGRLDLWLQIKIDEASTTPVSEFVLPAYKMTLSMVSS